MHTVASDLAPAERASFVHDRIPPAGLFAGHEWRISPQPFPLPRSVADELESLGRVLLQFYRAANRLYAASREDRQPRWVAEWLEQGKPPAILELQNSAAFKNDVPRVIRPDVLLTDEGLSIIELDSVPGGIGLTAWLNQTYSAITIPTETAVKQSRARPVFNPSAPIIGGADGMLQGFEAIFDGAPNVHIIVSEESATYQPEMQWLAEQTNPSRFKIRDASFTDFKDGDAVYRFFELFDADNVANALTIFDLARQERIRVTPPPKPLFEEKMLFALLWNRNLRDFWRQQLGESFLQRLQKLVPYTWLVHPAPLPPHGALPRLELTDWQQLKTLSQRERDLVLKVSGFSPDSWGARGVFLGSDLSQPEWSAAVDLALESFSKAPYVLQRFEKPKVVESNYYDFERKQFVAMPGRVRLCPYYFVIGEGDAARAQLGGVLATICPADKKIIHGMRDAILAPCARAAE